MRNEITAHPGGPPAPVLHPTPDAPTQAPKPDGGVADDIPVGNVYDKESSRHPVERRLVGAFSQTLIGLLPTAPGAVLEVGCGEGCQLRKVADAVTPTRLVGFDLPSPHLAARWNGLDADMVCGDGASLPFRSGAFDTVLALEMLEHVEDPGAVLGEIARVARSTVILSVPWEPVWRLGNLARGRYVRALGNTPGHVQHFTRAAFLRLVEHHLDVTEVRRPFPWTFVQARVRGGRSAP